MIYYGYAHLHCYLQGGNQVEELRRQIIELVYKRAYQRRKVRLASGRESNFYVDCKEVILTPDGLYKTARYVLALMQQQNLAAEAAGGPVMGAVPLASAVSALSFEVQGARPLASFFVRPEAKEHGTGRLVEGPLLREGMPVILLDDVLTTGGSVLRAAQAVQEQGCRVEQVLVIVDRQEGGRENLEEAGLSVSAILTREELEQL